MYGSRLNSKLRYMQGGIIITAIRHFVSYIVAAAILIGIIPASADNAIYDDSRKFSVSITDCNAYITGFCPDTEPALPAELTIPAEVTVNETVYRVKGIGDNAFRLKKNIKYLNVESGVESIGVAAFETCTALITVNLPSTVTTLSNKAFKNCTAVKHISLGNGIRTVGSEVFYNMNRLNTLIIPESVIYFEWLAFNYSRFNGTVIFLSSMEFETKNKCTTWGDNIKFCVRTEAQKKHLIDICDVKEEKITVIPEKSVLLLPGYNGDNVQIVSGNTVSLPTAVSREQFDFAYWEDAAGRRYTAGGTYTVSGTAEQLTAKWQISNSSVRIKDSDMESAVGYPDQIKALISKDEAIFKNTNLKTAVNVNVDETKVTGKTKKNILGIQYEAQGSELLMNENTHELSDDYLEAAKDMFKIPLARWGGGSANSINLWSSVPPYEERSDNYYINNLYRDTYPNANIPADNKACEKAVFGPVEFINSVLTVNPEAEFIFTIGMFVSDGDDTENFLRFLLDPSENWARLRQDYGLISGGKTVNIIGIELGNEMWGDAVRSTPQNDEGIKQIMSYAEKYAAACMEHITAIKKVREELGRQLDIITVTPADHTFWPSNWNRGVIRYLRPYDDGIYATHTYSYTVNADSINVFIDDITRIYREEIGYETSPKFYMTEHAIWDGAGYTYRLVSMYSALAEVSALNTMMLRSDILGANYHTMTGIRLWRMIQDKDGKMVLSPNALIYKAYLDCLGDRLISAEYDDFVFDDKSYSISPTVRTTDRSVSVLVTAEGNDTLKVIAVSNSIEEIKDTQINFNFKNKYDLTSAKIFTAPNMQSCIADGTDDVITYTETLDSPVKDADSFTLPPQCAAFLTFKLTDGSIAEEISEADYELPENALYRNVLDGITADSDGVYTLASPSKIDRVVIENGSEDLVVRARSVFGNWEVLASGKKRNQAYNSNRNFDKYYDAVKIFSCDGAIISVLAELDTGENINTVLAASELSIYPRLGGADYFDAQGITFTSHGFGMVNGTKIHGGNNIVGDVTASDGKNSVTAKLYLAPRYSFFTYVDDFSEYIPDSDMYGVNTENGVLIGNGNWVSSVNTNTGQQVSPSFGIVDSALYGDNGMKFSDMDGNCLALYDTYTQPDDPASYQSILYDGDTSSLGNAFAIHARITRTDANTAYGIKFMVHNDGKNFYALMYDRWSSRYTSPMWTLWKVEDGVGKVLVNGISLGIHTNVSMDISLTYDNGRIYWETSVPGGRSLNEKFGSYTDSKPFIADRSKFGFACYSTAGSRRCGILADNVSVRGINSVVSTMTVEYIDADVSEDYSGLLLFDVNDSGRTATVSGLKYTASEPYEINIPGTVCFGGVRYIVTKIADSAFAGTSSERNTLLTKVTLPDTLTEIGSDAFAYCSSLVQVIFPNSLKKIGDRAFLCCSNFKKLGVLPANITLGDRAFDSITFESEALIIPGDAHLGRTFKSARTKATVFGEGITSLASEEFYSNRVATKIILPSTCSSVSLNAFNSADKLQDIYLLSDSIKFVNGKLDTGAKDGEIVFHVTSEDAKSAVESIDTGNYTTVNICAEVINEPFTVLCTGPENYEIVTDESFVLPETEYEGYAFFGYTDGNKVYKAGETYTAAEPKVITAMFKKSSMYYDGVIASEDSVRITSPVNMDCCCVVARYNSDGMLIDCIVRKIYVERDKPVYVALNEKTAEEIIPGGTVKVMFLKDMNSLEPLCELFTFNK